MECEIMCVLADEARESYRPELVFELQNDTHEQLEQNVTRVCEWLAQWRAEHHPPASDSSTDSVSSKSAVAGSSSAPNAAALGDAGAPPATKRRAH